MKKQPIRMITLIIGIAYFLEWVDVYALNTAFPQIAKSFHTNPMNIKEALTVYLFIMGFFIPLSGWLGEKYGISRLYRYGIFIFLIGSIGCALSFNIITLIAFRCLQGIGGAFLTPLGRLIMIKVFGKNKITEAMAKITLVSSLGMMVGPFLGGALTTLQTWRWVFIINIPFGIVGLIFIKRYLPAFKKTENQPPFDVIGFVLLGSALALILYLLDIIPIETIDISIKVEIAIILFALFASYFIHTRYATHPLFPRNLFTQPFNFSLLGSLITRFGIAAPAFLIPLLLQTHYQYTAFEAGLFLLPTAVGIPLGKRCLKLVSNYFSKKIILIIITILNAVTLFAFSLISIHLSNIILVIIMFLFGIFMSIQQTET